MPFTKSKPRPYILFLNILFLFGLGCVPDQRTDNEIHTTTIPDFYKPLFLNNLEQETKESSGLAFFNEQLWTINDSGNENIIYQINKLTGKVTRQVMVSNAENIDWESMAQSDTHLFIGDFGNNLGNRKDLVVLKIEKKKILESDQVLAEKIHFTYPDQESFDEGMHKHNFDCEAFIYAEGRLHLFTKNWADNMTKHYTLSSQAGTEEAFLQDTYNVEGLITGADINTKSGNIVLLGYENKGLVSQSFVWILSDYPSLDVFQGNNKKIMLGSPANLGQTEAIQLQDNNTGFISSEAIERGNLNVEGKLFTFDFNSFL